MLNKAIKKIYLKQNVYVAALERLRFLFDEFENVMVSISGGKDSTVVLELSLIVAKEKGRLPLDVMFLDQEAEYQNVIDYVREIADRPEVNMHWLQMPFTIGNNTNAEQPFLNAWYPEEKSEWMRPQEPDAITKNIYGAIRFIDIFDKFLKVHYNKEPAIYIAGVRCEESPTRQNSLTYAPTYKHVTWGKKLSTKDQYNFYPLYDWSISDIWKAIHDNKWSYCPIYDYLYQRGIPIKNMRVSSLIHETAIKALYELQEIEPETWVKLQQRVVGVNTVGQMKNEFQTVKELPYMFKDWKDYRDYLLENLIVDEKQKKLYAKKFAAMDELYCDLVNPKQMYKVQIKTILKNDYDMTSLAQFDNHPDIISYKKWKKGTGFILSTKQIPEWAELPDRQRMQQ